MEHGRAKHEPQPRMYFTDQIDDFGGESSEEKYPARGSWGFYKKVRKLGLTNDQILILIRRFYLDRSFRQIMEDMNYTSMDVLFRRYQKALTLLKKRGFTG